jgi:outer membrane immunogenic protein
MNRVSPASLLLPAAALFVVYSFQANAQSQIAKSTPTQPPGQSVPNAAAYSWTGFYMGVNAGLNGGTYQYRPVEVEAIVQGEPEEPTLNRMRTTASGGVIGIQGGYLYQLPSNIVLGVEADFNWTDYRSSAVLSEISGAGEAESELAKLRVGYFGTLRARLGYAIGPALPYVTGGVAFGRTTFLFAEGEAEPGQPPVAKSGRTTWGYSLGAGLEYAITPALRLKTEYLYTSLASLQAVGLENSTFKLGSSFNTVRIGLNYAFGQDYTQFQPISLRNGRAPQFEGFSLSLNAGITAGSSVGTTVTTEETETSSLNESFQLAGGFIGAELGYQYQFQNNFVLGAFADYQFTNYKKEAIEAEQNIDESAKEKKIFAIPQFGTVRLRAGYAMGSFLPYVTAGFAYGQTDFRKAELPAEEGVTPSRINKTSTGYVVGVGAEYAITSQLFFKTEYLYVNLGRIKGVAGANETVNASMPMNIGRVGLSYRF